MDPVAAHGGGRHHFGPAAGAFPNPFVHGGGGQQQAYELHGQQQMVAIANSSMVAKHELVDESGGGDGEQIMGQAAGEDPHGPAGRLRRPRGRPAGSKNKPKPPVIITRDSASALKAQLLEVASGYDVVDAVAGYARRRRVGICVLGATGAVAGLAVRQPAGGGVLSIAGRFDILSLSGSFLPSPAPPSAAAGLAVFVSGAGGQVVGGAVAGALVADGPVVIVAASFANAAYERLPLAADDDGAPPQQQSAAPDHLAPLPAAIHQQSLAMMSAAIQLQLPGEDDGYGGWNSNGAGSSRGVGHY